MDDKQEQPELTREELEAKLETFIRLALERFPEPEKKRVLNLKFKRIHWREQLGIEIQFSTAGDDLVCDRCQVSCNCRWRVDMTSIDVTKIEWICDECKEKAFPPEPFIYQGPAVHMPFTFKKALLEAGGEWFVFCIHDVDVKKSKCGDCAQ